MEEIEEETPATDPKITFLGMGTAAILLDKNPDDDRWKKLNPLTNRWNKLPPRTEKDAKAYSPTSRSTPASDSISRHEYWKATQDAYYTWLEQRHTGRRWMESLVAKQIDVAWDMWQHYNQEKVQ